MWANVRMTFLFLSLSLPSWFMSMNYWRYKLFTAPSLIDTIGMGMIRVDSSLVVVMVMVD